VTRETQDAARPLRASEVADKLGLNVETVYRLIGTGEIQAFRIGGSVRIPASEIDRIMTTSAAKPEEGK
jgi:excisionase family DNA binding protein